VAVVDLQHVSTPYASGREDELRAFYGELLGLREKAVPDSLADRAFVWYAAGEAERELHFLPEDGALDRREARHFCLQVDDLDDLRRRLHRAGHETRDGTPIENRPRFFCRDPFGNLIELTEILGRYGTG